MCFTQTLLSILYQFEPLATDKDWEPSFFNLEVELLLEGMEGVLILDDYRFHAHRGFGDLYTTEVRHASICITAHFLLICHPAASRVNEKMSRRTKSQDQIFVNMASPPLPY